MSRSRFSFGPVGKAGPSWFGDQPRPPEPPTLDDRLDEIEKKLSAITRKIGELAKACNDIR